MTLIKSATLTALFYFTACLQAANQADDHNALKAQASAFFDSYLNTYNQRFGHPERKDAFVKALSGHIHQPFVMAPPSANNPFYPDTPEFFARAFDGFVTQLEQKGAIRMAWKAKNFKVLTPNKILANNIGEAFNEAGDVVYQTISLYLIHKDKNDGQWKIVMFSPYHFENELKF